MPIRTLLALLAAALLALGAVACGSDDDNGDGGGGAASAETSEQEPLSTNAYLEEVNSAQTDFSSDAAKLNLANPSSPKGFKRSLDRLVGLIDGLTERLDAVAPPTSVESQHDQLVAQLTEYGDAIERQKGGLGSSDQAKVSSSASKIGEASTTFSTDFTETINKINGRLKK